MTVAVIEAGKLPENTHKEPACIQRTFREVAPANEGNSGQCSSRLPEIFGNEILCVHLKEAIVDMDVFVAEFEKVAGAPRVGRKLFGRIVVAF